MFNWVRIGGKDVSQNVIVKTIFSDMSLPNNYRTLVKALFKEDVNFALD